MLIHCLLLLRSRIYGVSEFQRFACVVSYWSRIRQRRTVGKLNVNEKYKMMCYLRVAWVRFSQLFITLGKNVAVNNLCPPIQPNSTTFFQSGGSLLTRKLIEVLSYNEGALRFSGWKNKSKQDQSVGAGATMRKKNPHRYLKREVNTVKVLAIFPMQDSLLLNIC